MGQVLIADLRIVNLNARKKPKSLLYSLFYYSKVGGELEQACRECGFLASPSSLSAFDSLGRSQILYLAVNFLFLTIDPRVDGVGTMQDWLSLAPTLHVNGVFAHPR